MKLRLLLLAVPLFVAIAGAVACEEDEEVVGTTPATSTSVTAKTPAPTPPTDWGVYTDSIFGFSFPYPGNLEAKDETPQPPPGPMRTDWPLRVVVFEPDDGRAVMVISVYDNAVELSPSEWAREFTACHFEEPFEIQTVTVDGATGITCTAEPLGVLEPSLILSRGDNIFFLSTLLTASEFMTLLGGFRFP
jgi:hypothetical protein